MTSRPRRVVPALCAATAVVLAAAAPAGAAAAIEVGEVSVDASLRSVDLRVTGAGLPDGEGLDPAAVTVSVDGRTLPTTAVVAEQTAAVTAPMVLLVVDTSGSMLGTPMSEAKAAISAFASQAAPQVAIGLMTFSTSPTLVVPPTIDRSRLLGAVTAMQAQGETALYDATIAGAHALGTDGDRRLVILSDGGDTRSRTALDQVLAEVSRSGVSAEAIGFRTDESVSGTLEKIAAAGRGRVHAALTAAELSAALAATSRPLVQALTLHVLVPEDVRGERMLEVVVGSTSGALRATAEVPLGADATATPKAHGWWGSRDALLAGLAAIAGALLLGTAALLGSGRDRRKVHAVLDRYTTAPAPAKHDLKTTSSLTRTALDIADKVATSRNLQDRLTAKLERAAVALSPAEWLLMQAGVAFMVALLLVLLGWNLLVALLVGALVGWFVPRTYLGRKGARRQKAFEERLPDALQMVAGSLSAGYSLAQALDGVVREGTEPLATEFGRALAESRLGVPIETTLQGVAERMGSRDFGWVVMSIRVQREVGGNLAGILTTVTATMRERAGLKRHVKALSAEGRLSAYILLGMPLVLAIYLLALRGEYIQPLYTTFLGIVLIVVAGVLMAVGSFVMSRMVKVEA
ncbi:MAG: type II secretion system F family protein [Actinomycetes bacterium]